MFWHSDIIRHTRNTETTDSGSSLQFCWSLFLDSTQFEVWVRLGHGIWLRVTNWARSLVLDAYSWLLPVTCWTTGFLLLFFFLWDWRKCPASPPEIPVWGEWDWKKSIWVSKLALHFDNQNFPGFYMGNTSRRSQPLLEETEYFNSGEPDTGENRCAESMYTKVLDSSRSLLEIMWKNLNFVFWVWRNRSNI